MAQWLRLHLPSCGPGFDSQARHLHIFPFKFKLRWEKDENKQDEAGISLLYKIFCKILDDFGREPWFSGYGRRLMFQRLWVQIPAPYIFVVQILMFVWKDENKNEKQTEDDPFKKKFKVAVSVCR